MPNLGKVVGQHPFHVGTTPHVYVACRGATQMHREGMLCIVLVNSNDLRKAKNHPVPGLYTTAFRLMLAPTL